MIIAMMMFSTGSIDENKMPTTSASRMSDAVRMSSAKHARADADALAATLANPSMSTAMSRVLRSNAVSATSMAAAVRATYKRARHTSNGAVSACTGATSNRLSQNSTATAATAKRVIIGARLLVYWRATAQSDIIILFFFFTTKLRTCQRRLVPPKDVDVWVLDEDERERELPDERETDDAMSTSASNRRHATYTSSAVMRGVLSTTYTGCGVGTWTTTACFAGGGLQYTSSSSSSEKQEEEEVDEEEVDEEEVDEEEVDEEEVDEEEVDEEEVDEEEEETSSSSCSTVSTRRRFLLCCWRVWRARRICRLTGRKLRTFAALTNGARKCAFLSFSCWWPWRLRT